MRWWQHLITTSARRLRARTFGACDRWQAEMDLGQLSMEYQLARLEAPLVGETEIRGAD